MRPWVNVGVSEKMDESIAVGVEILGPRTAEISTQSVELASSTRILTGTMSPPPGRHQATLNALVSWPSDFMTALVKKSLSALQGFDIEFANSPESILSLVDQRQAAGENTLIVQWCTYDDMLHELTQKYPVEV